MRIAALIALTCAALGAADAPPSGVTATLAAKAKELSEAKTKGFTSAGGWSFLTEELRHYGAGPFWGGHAVTAAVAKKNQDPLPVIVDFNAQCAKAGVQLLLVPIPGKVALYPEEVVPGAAREPRLDAAHQQFYAELAKQNVTVVDLMPAFLALRAQGVDTHCRQDTHWSPAGMQRAAEVIAEAVAATKALPAPSPAPEITRAAKDIQARGDILSMLGDTTTAPEALRIETITLSGKSVAVDGADPVDKAAVRASPFLIIGDSHGIVYSKPIDGGIAAFGAGISDHLAARVGIRPDVIAVLGSGANAPRGDLARRKDDLAGKKVIVWLFTIRQFTEAGQGWSPIPVVR